MVFSVAAYVYLSAMDTSAVEEEIEVSGIVEEISGRLFVVSADLEDERRYLWCPGDRVFHNGQQYGESLENILELLMPIDLIVRSELGDYIVLAAWVGEKPEIIEVGDKLLNPVYGVQGNLCRFQKDGSIVIVALKGDFSVLIRKEVVYLDGYPLDNGTEDLMGQIVSFDAVPLMRKDISGAIYAATCVWLGDTAPRVVDRFQLHGCGEDLPRVKMEVVDSDVEIESLESPSKRVISLDDSEIDDDIQIIDVIIKNDSVPARLRVQEISKERSSLFEKFAVGTVCVIPSKVLAFVNACIDGDDVKVMLFRHSFGNCYNIRDVVSVGDRLCLLLRSASLFPGSNTWIVVKASKGSSNPKRLAEMMLPTESRLETERAVEESTNGSPVGQVLEKESTPVLPVQRVPVEGSMRALSVHQSSLVLPAEIDGVEMSAKELAPAVPMEIEDGVPVKVDIPQRVEERINTRNGAPPVVVKSEVGVENELPVVRETEILKPIVLKPFAKQYATEDVVLNGTGRLVRHGAFFVAEMQLLPVKVLIRSNLFYINGKLYSTDACQRQLGKDVSFDAVKLKKSRHSSGATHRAILNWQGFRPTPQTVLKQAKLNPLNGKVPFRPNTVYVGLVMDVPLFDCCIVKFGALPVLVQSKSLLVDPWTKDTSPIVINDYLKFGDHVALTCKIEDNCVVAEVCGMLPSFDSLFGAVGILDKKSLSVTTSDVNVSLSQAEIKLVDVLRCTPMYLEPNEAYKAIIVEFPYRNYGIAIVGEIRVLVHVNCLVDVQGRKGSANSISDLLNIGSTVVVWVERKTVQFTSYYLAREARLIYDNSSKNKVVLKNYNGLVENVKFKRSTIQVCGRRIETDTRYCRLNPFKVPRFANVNKLNWKLTGFAPVRVSVTVNDDGDVIHSVLLL